MSGLLTLGGGWVHQFSWGTEWSTDLRGRMVCWGTDGEWSTDVRGGRVHQFVGELMVSGLLMLGVAELISLLRN